VDDIARAMGAVNTLTQENGAWHGSNTDAYGFITHVKQCQPNATELFRHAVVLGAGGAARAAIYALKQEGAARITILNRTHATAKVLAQEFSVEAAPMDAASEVFATASLLANTTSAGMKTNAPLVLPIAALPAHAVVYDIVYAPLVTPLLADAQARGLATVDGLGMLLYQAQKAFTLWWGITPEVTESLRAHVLREVL
jgi:shikimate dehydrogenase